MLAEILAYNIKSALCRSASFAFSFVSLRLATASLFKIRDPARETSQFYLRVAWTSSKEFLTTSFPGFSSYERVGENPGNEVAFLLRFTSLLF